VRYFRSLLARHPTLERLSISHEDDFERLWHEEDASIDAPDFMPMMTNVERSALFAAWGTNRRAEALTVDF